MRVVESKGTVMDGATATCYGCENQVVLGLTPRGAMLPLDPAPTQTGGLAVSVPAPGKAPQVRYLRGEDPQLAAGEQRMTAHWDTHPACKGERRARAGTPRKRAHKPRPALVPAAPARQDMTLADLEAANLDSILAAAGARRGTL